MKFIRYALLLGSFLGISCSSAPKSLIEPHLVLKEIALADATLSDSLVVFRLEIQNPNGTPLKVDSIDYQVRIKSKTYEGHLDQLPRVRANSNIEVEIPIKVIFMELFDSITLALYEKNVAYELNATMKTGRFRVPLKQIGRTAVLPP